MGSQVRSTDVSFVVLSFAFFFLKERFGGQGPWHWICLAVLAGVLINAWMDRSARKRAEGASSLPDTREISRRLAELALRDPAWNEAALLQGARELFAEVWRAYGAGDVTALRKSLAPTLAAQWLQVLEANRTRMLRHVVTDLRILEARIAQFEDHADNNRDSFVVAFHVSRTNRMTAASGNVVRNETGQVTEFWRFARSGSRYLVGDVVDSRGVGLQAT